MTELKKTAMKLKGMRYILFALLFWGILFAGCGTPPRNYADYSKSSGFKMAKSDSLSLENLEVLCKVWGYVKYHHPAFASDKYNIDYELFELLPKVAVADKEQRNEILLAWVNSFGKTKEDSKLKKTEQTEEYITLPDFKWLQDTLMLGRDLSGKLTKMRYAQRPDSSFYVHYSTYGAGNPEFINEDKYPKATLDCGYMMLGVFRLWNIIEYYCPNRNITDNDWGEVLPKYIKIVCDGDVSQYRRNMAMLIAEIDDTHSNFDVSFVLGKMRIPLKMSFIEDKLIVDSDPFGRNDEFGISVGDRILSIDGLTPDDIKERVKLYRSLSNEASLDREAARIASYVNRGQVTKKPVSVRIERYGTGNILEIAMPSINESEYNTAVKDASKSISEHKNTRLITDDIGYFNPYDVAGTNNSGYSEDKADSIMSVFKDTKAIIVDMRGYPPSLAYSFIPKYLMSQRTPFVTFTMPTLSLPGTYRKQTISVGTDNLDVYKGEIIVLVNEKTQSASEWTTMAFQALPNCTVVGSQSAGADGNVSPIILPGQIKFWISGLGVYYPDGTNAQRAGVKIDHNAAPTIGGIVADRDEVLEKAVELANAG